MAKRKTSSKETGATADSLDAVYVTHYEITYEPIQDRNYRRLPEPVKAAVDRLYKESQTRPRQAIPELQEMIEKYPNLPTLYNYLAMAYSRIGEIEKAEAITRANLQRNPDYLFARLNYAEFCLRRKEYDKIPEIFENKFDLQLLYPKRKKFHISEVANFMGLLGLYFYAIGKREIAEKYNEILQEIAPDKPMARKLKRRLSLNIFHRLWNRLKRP